MTSTVLETLQEASRLLGIKPPSTIVSTEVTTQQLLSAYHSTGENLSSQYSWPILRKRGFIVLQTGVKEYPLKNDFFAFYSEAFWDQGQQFPLTGPLTAREWEELQSGSISSYPRKQFSVFGNSTNQFYIEPAPTAGENGNLLVYNYSSNNWLRPKLWATGESFSANSYCWYNGRYYQTTSGGVAGATAPTHETGTQSDGSIDWMFSDVLYNKALADTDVSFFDEELMKLGTAWLWGYSKRFPYAEHKRAYGARLNRLKPNKTSRDLYWGGMAARKTTRLINNSNLPDSGYG